MTRWHGSAPSSRWTINTICCASPSWSYWTASAAHGTPHPSGEVPGRQDMDSFDFLAMPSVNKTLVLELARSEFLARRENVLLLGNSGTGKRTSPWLWDWRLPARASCALYNHRRLVSELIEAATRRSCSGSRSRSPATSCSSSMSWASCPYPRRRRVALRDAQPALRTRINPGDQQSALPGMDRDPRLGTADGALLDRLTHHVHILEMNGDSYRSSRAAANAPRLRAMNSTPPDAPRGRRAASATLQRPPPRILNNLTANYWPTFTPPHCLVLLRP